MSESYMLIMKYTTVVIIMMYLSNNVDIFYFPGPRGIDTHV